MSWRAQPNCPSCGKPVYGNHTCRASALADARRPGVPEGFLDLVEEEKAKHDREVEQLEILTLDEPEHVTRCRGCGREDRVIVHQEEQLCMPCLRREAESGAA